MHFHDCFVRGCDGSVLLNSPTGEAEKDAVPNLSLRGFQIIDKAKIALEEVCPAVVSCADVLATVARDELETGRRDGLVSNKDEALNNLLPHFANISTLIAGFVQKGLSVKDLVVLSCGHTIGTSYRAAFNNPLYTDPTLDSEHIEQLKLKCTPGDQNSIVEMDPGSFKTFDQSYYTLVVKRRGLFESEAALLNNTTSHGSTFFQDFGESLVRMDRIGVLTGATGEIRKDCTRVN
ncbi:Peroxidase [Bertholletia excelsa]